MLAWRTIRLRDDRLVLVRAAEPADAQRLQAFVRGLPVQARIKRFFAPIRELSPRELRRLVAPAGAQDLHLLAMAADGRIAGSAECVVQDDGAAEFGIVVAEAWQRAGLGARLLGLLLEHARRRGLAAMRGVALAGNWEMLGLAAKLGFELEPDADPDLVRLELPLGLEAAADTHSAWTAWAPRHGNQFSKEMHA